MARPTDDADDPTDLDPDEAVLCIDCGNRNDNATPGEACEECFGTFHLYARLPADRDDAITAGDLEERRVRWDEHGRQYRALAVLLEDIETGEFTAVKPYDLRKGFSAAGRIHR